MGGKKVGKTLRSKWGLLATAVALVAALATIPAVGLDDPSSPWGPLTLALHLDADDRGTSYFEYTSASGEHTIQEIGRPNRCVPRSGLAGPLVSVGATSGGSAVPVGLVSGAMGAKSGNAQGIPCSRVETSYTENLTIDLDGVPDAIGAELDLELKGAAEITVKLYKGGIHTEDLAILSGPGFDDGTPYEATASPGSAATCLGSADSGADSGSNDNCRVTLDPANPFDEVHFVATNGEFSLEGGSDFGNARANDTVFFLDWDGTLICGQTTPREVDGDVSGAIKRHENTDVSECVAKPYTLDVQEGAEGEDDTLTFEVGDQGSQPAIYEAWLTFTEGTATLFNAVLEYDSQPPYNAADFKTMPACVEDPFDVGDDPLGSTLNDEAIPSGHEGCVISVTQQYDGTTDWHVIFEGDWRFK